MSYKLWYNNIILGVRTMITNVYSITNKLNGKRYIGVSQDVKTRKRAHLWRLRNERHTNTKLTNAYKKYGESAFVFEILEELSSATRDELLEREIHYIEKFNTYRNGYNMSLGADGSALAPVSEETREKHRQNWLGNTIWKGRKHTDETKRLIGDAHRGKVVSAETRAKLSINAKGRTGEKNPFFGKKHTDESKAKMSQAQGKKCQCIETGVIYNSITECANKMGIPEARSHINRVCRGKAKQTRGYTFKYVD